MAIPEKLIPCQTKKVCDDADATIYPIMKHLVEVDKLSERAAAKSVSNLYDGAVTETRARKIYYDRKGGTTVPPAKPSRKHTNPEVKKQLNKTAEAIAKGEVSDNDIVEVDRAIAKAIKTGKAARRVGVSTANAVRTERKVKGGFKKAKPIDNFFRLNRHMKACIDGMTAWADGQIEPTSEDEALEARAILAKATSFMLQFARLGIDMEGIYDTFVRGDYENEKKQRNQIEFKSG